MPLFADEHPINEVSLEKIKEAINSDTGEFGVSMVELFYNPKTQEMHCLLEAPNVSAVLDHHAKLGIRCNSIIQVERIHTRTTENTERLAAIGELAARLAHDLRNPLSVIKNTVEIMESKQRLRIEERVIYFNRLHRAVERISHQIEDVLDFVRPIAMTFEKHLVNDIVSSALEKIARPDTIKINLPDNFVYLVCDFTRIEVVFTNLIMNAIQAMNNEGMINVKIFDSDSHVTIQIADTGSGIPQQVISRIFEPLFTTKQTGTGLGLASCKKIIEQHGGTITVSSTEGQGTTFTIKIPKQKSIPDQLKQPMDPMTV